MPLRNPKGFWDGVGDLAWKLVHEAAASAGNEARAAEAAALAEKEAASRREAAARAAAAEQEARENELAANAVSCKSCGNLAPPIAGTGNNYRCNGCGRQFRNGRHGF